MGFLFISFAFPFLSDNIYELCCMLGALNCALEIFISGGTEIKWIEVNCLWFFEGYGMGYGFIFGWIEINIDGLYVLK